MTISVIIPAYNSSQTIKQAILSLIGQLKPGDEIIVVDDGSTDNTVKIIKSISKVKLLSQPHQGPAIARNLGVSKAKGKILVFVDADMKFDPDFLAQLTKPIKNKKAKGSWSGNEWVDNWHNVWARCLNYNQNRASRQMTSSYQGQKKVFRAVLKSEFDKVHGFDSIGYNDDWTLVSKLGYQPKTTLAKFYHHNPDTLLKVYKKALWIGKRSYKLKTLGTLIAIFRANAAFSVIIGIYKSIKHLTPAFLPFKLVYDLGIMTGAVLSLSGKKY